MFRRKEQDKTPEKELNEMEISNPLNKELKVMIVKTLNELKRRTDEHCEKFNRELETSENNQTELRNMIAEIQNTLEGINCRLEEQSSELEDRVVEITQVEQKKK